MAVKQVRNADHVVPKGGTCVVVGAGPVGMRAARELAPLGVSVRVIGAEPQPPYNRVRLTPLLSGDVQFGEILLDGPQAGEAPFEVMLGQRVEAINRAARQVILRSGQVVPYDTLVLATGSSAFVPGIPGRDLAGVYTFRTADDASALLARSFSARRVAVIGGGLLGLEAARGMRRRQCDVTVIEHEGRLMPRQLDPAGGALLSERIRALGVAVITGEAVKQISGNQRVTGLTLGDGRQIECDTVIICTGVRPNVGLARAAKLGFSRGVLVDDTMRTNDPNIFAIGECAEHDGVVHGVVGPGYAQARVAASVIAGVAAQFESRAPSTKLKVIGADVFSVGPVELLEEKPNVRAHLWQGPGLYRRIFIERGRFVGGIAVGAWDQVGRLQDAVQSGATIYPWMLFRFLRTGEIWPETDPTPDAMPDASILCNCTGVTYGQARGAVQQGAATVAGVGQATGAGTVCGTCRAVVSEIIDAGAPPEPQKYWQPLAGLSAVALLGVAYPIAAGHVPLPTAYSAESLRTWLWQDNIVKQYSGFILLALTLAGFVIGLRKRLRFMDRLGGFEAWRLVHLAIGVLSLAGLVAHTGFNLGTGWNLALGLSFLGTLAMGAFAGLATGGEHELRARRIGTARNPPRKLPTWAHIVALWPLPALIGFHVLASYAF